MPREHSQGLNYYKLDLGNELYLQDRHLNNTFENRNKLIRALTV